MCTLFRDLHSVADDCGQRRRPPMSSRSIIVNGVPPLAPTGLSAATIARKSIGLKWTNGTIAQTGVGIERCTGSSCTNFAQVASVAGTATSFTGRVACAADDLYLPGAGEQRLRHSAILKYGSARTGRSTGSLVAAIWHRACGTRTVQHGGLKASAAIGAGRRDGWAPGVAALFEEEQERSPVILYVLRNTRSRPNTRNAAERRFSSASAGTIRITGGTAFASR